MTEQRDPPPPEPIQPPRGGTVLGPRNEPVERQHPDLLVPPATDRGTLPNLKFPFDQARMRLEAGGWSREVTARELPVATTLAAVDGHAEVPAVVSWPRSLAGPPHAAGGCLTSQTWDARAGRLLLGFAPHRHCVVQVR